MREITPENFWDFYRTHLTGLLTSQPGKARNVLSYGGATMWTKEFAIPAAVEACRRLGLQTATDEARFWRLDVAGYQQRMAGDDESDDLRIAFEHENKPGSCWHHEFWKLCHVVADLCVLVTYYAVTRNSSTFQQEVQSRIDLMGDKTHCVPRRRWLLIWGPVDSTTTNQEPYVAYTLAGRQLEKISEDKAFLPADFFEATPPDS